MESMREREGKDKTKIWLEVKQEEISFNDERKSCESK